MSACKASSASASSLNRLSMRPQRTELKTLGISADLSGKDLLIAFQQLDDFIVLHKLGNAPESCMMCALMADNDANKRRAPADEIAHESAGVP
jgi:hypothetical protein